MKKILILSAILFGSVAYGQTGPEKVAGSYCKCTETHDITPYVKIFRSEDQKTINENSEEIENLFWELKNCAKKNTVLTAEESKKVPESEVNDALEKNCPDVLYFMEQYRRKLL